MSNHQQTSFIPATAHKTVCWSEQTSNVLWHKSPTTSTFRVANYPKRAQLSMPKPGRVTKTWGKVRDKESPFWFTRPGFRSVGFKTDGIPQTSPAVSINAPTNGHRTLLLTDQANTDILSNHPWPALRDFPRSIRAARFLSHCRRCVRPCVAVLSGFSGLGTSGDTLHMVCLCHGSYWQTLGSRLAACPPASCS